MRKGGAGKEDKDNVMLYFYEGEECDIEDPGDPDVVQVDNVVGGEADNEKGTPSSSGNVEAGEFDSSTDDIAEVTPDFPQPVPTMKKTASSTPIRFTAKVRFF